jgi:hypothetical protein
MALNVFASFMLQSFAAHLQVMRAKTKPASGGRAAAVYPPPAGFVISPEIPAALDHIVISRTLCGFASEQSVKFPG